MFGVITARQGFQRSIHSILSLLLGPSSPKAMTEEEWNGTTANHAQNQCRCGLTMECGNYKNKLTMHVKARD